MTPPRSSVANPRAAARSARASNGEQQTRDLLIETALKLFARHGLDGVSLRQIAAEAGQSNQSVVHYYFQSKRGLVAAVLNHVVAQLHPLQEAAAVTLAELRRTQGALTVRDIVAASLMPVLLWHATSPEGRRAIRFLARLTWQSDQDEFDLLVATQLPSYRPLLDNLCEALPDVPREVLAAKLMFAMINIVHGLSTLRLLVSAKGLGIEALTAHGPEGLQEPFIDYLVGGLLSGSAPPAR